MPPELILALDLPTAADALRLLDRVGAVSWVKVGAVLFTTAGPSLIGTLKDRGHRVFLDLKWHDIPNTVAGAVRGARAAGVEMVTVHSLGGKAMLEAAKEAAGPGTSVVAVTVLTSHDPAGFGAVVGRAGLSLAGEVERLARLAQAAGVDGVVSSPLETALLRRALGPAALLVTPGIRSAGDPAGDQVRVATAGEAAAAGATHLVVGRPVLAATDPAAAWARLAGEIA